MTHLGLEWENSNTHRVQKRNTQFSRRILLRLWIEKSLKLKQNMSNFLAFCCMKKCIYSSKNNIFSNFDYFEQFLSNFRKCSSESSFTVQKQSFFILKSFKCILGTFLLYFFIQFCTSMQVLSKLWII